MTDATITETNPVLKRLEEGTLIQNAFDDVDDEGRHLACLYSAYVTGATSTENCPAHIMPQWVADLTPWYDDSGTKPGADGVWRNFIVRYVKAQEKWHVLSGAQWLSINQRFRAWCAADALEYAAKVVPPDAPYWQAVVSASVAVTGSLMRGVEPTHDVIQSSRAAADAATYAAAYAADAADAADAAYATARAADAATYAAADAADKLKSYLMDLIEAELMVAV